MNNTAPEQRNGAKGNASLRPAPVSSMQVNPTTEPTKDAIKSVMGIDGQPKNAPIIASNLMSTLPVISLIAFSLN